VERWGKRNRQPERDELEACWDFFDQQIQALPNVELILAFGATAGNRALGRKEDLFPLWRLRQKYLSSIYADPQKAGQGDEAFAFLGTYRLPLVVTYHPSYLIRTPAEKLKAYEDLKFAKAYLDTPYAERDLRFDRAYPEDPPRRGVYPRLEDKRVYGHPKPFQHDHYNEEVYEL
jgi:uracil-DNA glycosylase family 4